jgi:outer membrane protein assembly factor BamE (lipoprotein component of BamABCDE complex)
MYKISVKIKKLSVVIFLLLALNSCLSRPEKRGYIFDGVDHGSLQEGITTKEKVLKIMGSPTLISDLDYDETWIYYAEDSDSFLFFRPNITGRNIFVLSFDSSETLKELQKISFADEEKKLKFISNYTKVQTQEVGFFKSIFSNVGELTAQ